MKISSTIKFLVVGIMHVEHVPSFAHRQQRASQLEREFVIRWCSTCHEGRILLTGLPFVPAMIAPEGQCLSFRCMLMSMFDASECARIAERPMVGTDPSAGGLNVGIRTARLD